MTPPGPGRARRAEILAAASALLDTGGGVRAVTLRAVARRAGIAAPSIYPYFPDRPALVRAAVDRACAELARRLYEASRRSGDAPRTRLYAVCGAYLDFADECPERYRAMRGCAAATRPLTSALAECVASGDSTSEDPAGDAVALCLALHGLAHQRGVTRDLTPRLVVPLARLTDGCAAP